MQFAKNFKNKKDKKIVYKFDQLHRRFYRLDGDKFFPHALHFKEPRQRSLRLCRAVQRYRGLRPSRNRGDKLG